MSHLLEEQASDHADRRAKGKAEGDLRTQEQRNHQPETCTDPRSDADARSANRMSRR